MSCVNSSIGIFVLENVVLATKIMVLGGLEPEILATMASGAGHLGKWPPSLLWDKTAMTLYPKIFIRACLNRVPNVMLVS